MAMGKGVRIGVFLTENLEKVKQETSMSYVAFLSIVCLMGGNTYAHRQLDNLAY
jgi:hypothetical protein